MKLKRKYYTSTRQATYDLDSAIAYQLDGNDFGVGKVEAIENSTENCAKMLGRLIICLQEKQILNNEDIEAIVSDFVIVNDTDN